MNLKNIFRDLLSEGNFSQEDSLKLKRNLEECMELLDRYDKNRLRARILYNAIDKFLGENRL